MWLVCACELNMRASKCQRERARIHLRMIDWKVGGGYQAALSLSVISAPLWFPHHQPMSVSPSGRGALITRLGPEVKAINSWLQGAGGKSQSGHHGAHHKAARIQPSGTLHMMWGSLTWTRCSHSICHQSAPLSCTALSFYMMLYSVIRFKTFTVAIEDKHQGWKVKTFGKPPAG